ncbi:hypothetical protein ACUHMQ_18920, partial [Chitinimonas sp. PSY-7]|uniref:hypothetical protein n=1 Tax=Chitinimonas sp. PSY-7 TaxID=3459088 RepID=UPI00404006FF
MALPRTLDQIRTQNPQLDQLDDHTVMVGIYNRDFAGTMTPQQYMAATGYTPKASGMDYVKSAAAGAGDLVAAAGYGLQKLGADGLGGAIRDAGQTAQRYWVDDMSGGGRSVANNPIVTDDYSLGDTPLQSTLMAASRSVPGMVATAPVGGVIGLAAKSGLGRFAVAKGAQAAAEAGTATLVQKALMAAPGAIGMGVAEGGQAALVNAEQTHAKVMDLAATPEDVLLQNPTYRATLQQTRDPLAARKAVADETASQVLRNTMISTGGIGVLTGGGALGSVFNRVTGRAGASLAGDGLVGMAKSAAKDVGKEAGQEFLQSGAEQYIQNAAERDHLDPSKDAWRGVGPAALSGAAVGGLLGGGIHVLGKPFESGRAAVPTSPPVTGTTNLPAIYRPSGEYVSADEAIPAPEKASRPRAEKYNVTPDGVAIPVAPEVRALPDKSGTLYANQFGVASEQLADVAPNEQLAKERDAHTRRRDGALRVIGKIQQRASELEGEALALYQTNSAPALARAQQAWQESEAAIAGLSQASPASDPVQPLKTDAATEGMLALPDKSGTLYTNAAGQSSDQLAAVAPREQRTLDKATLTARRDGALREIGKIQARASTLQGKALVEFQAKTAPALARAQKVWQESDAALAHLTEGRNAAMRNAESEPVSANSTIKQSARPDTSKVKAKVSEAGKLESPQQMPSPAAGRQVQQAASLSEEVLSEREHSKAANNVTEVAPKQVALTKPTEKSFKWFTSAERAAAYIDKKKLTDTHAPVAVERLAPNGKHVTVYEVQPKSVESVNKTAQTTSAKTHAADTPAVKNSKPEQALNSDASASEAKPIVLETRVDEPSTKEAPSVSVAGDVLQQPTHTDTPSTHEKKKTTRKLSANAVSKAKSNLEDVGDALRWNRKGIFRNGGLTWDAIKDENDTLKLKLASKEKIWARPNWTSIIAAVPEDQREGFTVIAHLVKQVYDTIPKQSPAVSDQALQTYIEVVGELRESANALLNNKERQAALWEILVQHAAARQAGKQTFGDTLSSLKRDISNMPLFADLFPKQAAGERFSRGTPENDRAMAVGNKAVSAMQWDIRSVLDALKAVKDGWPAKQAAWQKQGFHIIATGNVTPNIAQRLSGHFLATLSLDATTTENLGRFETKEVAQDAVDEAVAKRANRFLLLNKGKSILGDFASEAEAIEAAQRQTARKSDTEPDKDVAPNDGGWERKGVDRRNPGENITPERLEQTFNFRGVNFGNWVSQDERQQHVNAAFDALHDLATAMGIPPAAIGLGGKLGLAFGAQGNGGRNAAHFVPGVNEINITRTSGAGALA